MRDFEKNSRPNLPNPVFPTWIRGFSMSNFRFNAKGGRVSDTGIIRYYSKRRMAYSIIQYLYTAKVFKRSTRSVTR